MSTNYISQITASNGTTYDIQEGVTTRIFRATCSTAAATAAKVATLDDATGYSLAAGVRVAVTFTYGNSAETPTLNVNSGGAKNIAISSNDASSIIGNGDKYNTWGPSETIIFTYNGNSSWISSGSSLGIYRAYSLANSKGNGTITRVKTTSGTHTAIDVTSGAAEFNVPTKTSHLTNDSGFLTAHQTYTSFTGKPTANQTPSFGSTFTISQISQSTSGQVSGTDRTITIPSTIATNTAVGLVKPWYTHTAASTGPTTGNNTTAVAVNAISTTSGKYYAVEADSNGRLFVNVPWTDHTYTVPTITLNGSATTSPSFYAPTGAGTSGYYLKSNGSGAPTWTSFPIIPTITDTYSSTSSNGMSGKAVASALGSYLPLSGGTMTGPITMAHGVSNAIYGTLQDGSSALPMLSMTHGDSTAENYIALGATNNNIPVGIYGPNVYLTSGGTLTLQGDITVKGHETPIGDVVPANKTQNIATGTSWVTTGCSVSLTQGVWVVVGSIEYAANATGRRGVEIYANGNMTHTQVNVAAGSNATTRLVTAGILEINVASMNVYIYGYQNSGSSLSQTTYMRAVRIR